MYKVVCTRPGQPTYEVLFYDYPFFGDLVVLSLSDIPLIELGYDFRLYYV